MDSKLKERFKKALDEENPEDDLVQIILDLKSEGWTQEKVYSLFSEALEYYSEHGTEYQDDSLRDTMDRIVGWCSEDQWLFDKYLPT